ncbi:alpha/beta hydrolase [Nocardia araoensis]|uniref:alpha/beta hydrolase n=1 Tax=Nocardia araoensis TaxID=228600 RepID=UPI00031A8B7C|nr:alpha/beta hydrolase family protein [Nocardia araoensis]
MRARTTCGPGAIITAIAVAITLAVTPLSPACPAATAEPPAASGPDGDDGARVAGIEPGTGRLIEVRVHSAAMGATVAVKVIRAPDNSSTAPTLYLLNGASGGSEGSNWPNRTDVEEFFSDKQVNVVVPMGGEGSYFADWRADDPVLGRQRWTTFLTRELPPLIDATFAGNGANAVAGISMAATSVFQLALNAPGLYRAIGSYSGCVRTSDPQGQAMVAAVVDHWRGNALNMWGPPSDPRWAANDPYLHAEQLRGTAIYVSTGTGLPGPFDRPDGPGIDGNRDKLVSQLVTGGLLEAIINRCAHDLSDRLRDLNIPATFDFRPSGTHSWGYWQEDLHNSWPLIAAALAGPATG